MAKFSLSKSEARIRRHYALLSGNRPPDVGVQLLHAPVFHGYGISLAVTVTEPASIDQVEAAIAGDHIDIITAEGDPPTNLSVAGQPSVLVRVRPQSGQAEFTNRFWIWAGLDNLRFAAQNAVACALELNRLRPHGEVQ